MLGARIRVPLLAGVLRMVVTYALTLLLVWLLSLIVDALAPTFGGTRNRVAALKVVAYSATASFVASILGVVPGLRLLAGLAGLVYSIYLLYTGLPVLMRTPGRQGRPVAPAWCCCASSRAAWCWVAVFALALSPLGGGGLAAFGAGRDGGSVVVNGPDGTTVTVDPGATNEIARRIEDAGKRAEAAQNSGDSAAAGKAMGDMMSVLAGMTGASAPIVSADLKGMLPEDARRPESANRSKVSGGPGARARRVDGQGGLRRGRGAASTSPSPTPAAWPAWAAMAGLAGVTMDKESDGQVEKGVPRRRPARCTSSTARTAAAAR